MADVLESILSFRKKALIETKSRIPLGDLEKEASHVPLNSIRKSLANPSSISVIAEMKRQSPSAGMIRSSYVVEDIALAYERGGAAALSVLTEAHHFGGDILDIRKVRAVTKLPILRKDFIFDPYQIVESKAYGADAVLLIADMLSLSQLKELVECAQQYKIDTLVEVFTTDVLPGALTSGSPFIGINTRNLRTLEMNPNNVLSLSRLIPKEFCVVAESGIKTPKDIDLLKPLHVNAILVGESLLKQENLEQAVKIMVEAGIKDES
ncbi:hypothetical protein BVX98_04440 [bacterium F11]|nr:hypothetical protein BVX98_04440 [bacterium F11]